MIVLVPNKFKLGIVNCSTHNIQQIIDEVRLLLNDKFLQPRTLLCVNAHIYNIASTDLYLQDILNEARIVAADGISIVWSSRLFGGNIKERTSFTETFRAFLMDSKMPSNKGIIVGCTEKEANQAANSIERMSHHCRIIKSVSGYLTVNEYKNIFTSIGDIDFVFLGMGSPRTEIMSKIAAEICPQAIVWGMGGGTIKIFAGTMKEAPPFFRRNGLQWLYRLCNNPLALWKRYMIGNFIFIYRIFKAKYGKINSNML